MYPPDRNRAPGTLLFSQTWCASTGIRESVLSSSSAHHANHPSFIFHSRKRSDTQAKECSWYVAPLDTTFLNSAWTNPLTSKEQKECQQPAALMHVAVGWSGARGEPADRQHGRFRAPCRLPAFEICSRSSPPRSYSPRGKGRRWEKPLQGK